MDRDDRLQGILHIFQTPHLLGSPVKEPSPKVPFMEPFTEKCPTTAALLHSPTKVRGIRAPSSLREMPTSRDFPNVSSRVPSEGAPPEANSTEHFQREMPSSKDFPNISSRVPSRGALLQVPQTGPLWRKMPVSRAFPTYPSGSPAREPSLQVAFTELPQRKTLHLQSPFQPYLKVPGRWAHYRLPNWAPVHPHSLPFITFRAPRKEAPLQVPPTEIPQREMLPFRSPPTISENSPSTDWMLPGCLLRSLQASDFSLIGTLRRILAGVPYCGVFLKFWFSQGEVWGPPSRASILGKARYIWDVAYYPRGCR